MPPARVIVELLEDAASRSASACPASTTSRCGRRCATRRSGWSACATSRPRPTRPTATRARPGRLGVALTTTGPGAANTLGAVGEAWASRSPVLVIATDIPSTLRRPASTAACCTRPPTRRRCSRPVVKAAHRALAAGEVGAAAAAALPTPLRRRTRPVYLEVADRPARRRGRRPRDGRAARAARAAGAARSTTPLRAARRRRAAADLGGHAARATRGDEVRRWPSGWPRRCSPPTAPRACCRPSTRAWSACRRTSSRPARCGTRPTS